MNRFIVLAFTAFVLCVTAAFAQDKLPGPKGGPISMTAISPIFGELVAFSLPANFRTVHENSNANNYIREAVLAGETVQRWTQMITVTGHKGMAANPAAMPQRFANLIAGGFNKACPETFSGSAFGDTKIDGETAELLLEHWSEREAMVRGSGVFGNKVDVPPDASAQDRLLGLLGRTP